MTCVLILLSTYETVHDKPERSWHGVVRLKAPSTWAKESTERLKFMSVPVSIAFSTLMIGIIGTRWAMREKQFWVPEIFIPTMGLLLGMAASSMAVGLDSCLSEVFKNQGRLETYLAFGATRFEAGRSIATDAVRLAMLPTINQISIVGFITIPGTMTGQILGGAPIMNAVRYQQVISFMITASSGLAVLAVVAVRMIFNCQTKPKRSHQSIVPPSYVCMLSSIISTDYVPNGSKESRYSFFITSSVCL